jgi:phosphodiesterase/alkaline phosphatase D-like protein
MRGLSIHRLLLTLALTAAVGRLLSPTPTVAQFVPPAKKAERVEITQGPVLERAREDFAIIRWTTNNPGGTERHFGVVYYGTDPKDLSQMAKSPIQLNRAHAETTFRVRMPGLKPQTTYYYRVTSMESNGKSDGVESPVTQFTTPSPGERIVAFPPQPARPR